MINKKYNISFKYIKNTLRMIKMHKHTIIYSRMSKDYTTHKCSLCNGSGKVDWDALREKAEAAK